MQLLSDRHRERKLEPGIPQRRVRAGSGFRGHPKVTTQTTRGALTRNAPDGDSFTRPNRCKICCILTTLAFLLAAPAAEAHTLTYRQARPAAQHTGDTFANQTTKLTELQRTSRHRFHAQATYYQVDRAGCQGCGYDHTTGTFYDTPVAYACHVQIVVRFKPATRRVVAYVDGHVCNQTFIEDIPPPSG